jgi:hypothetical protein
MRRLPIRVLALAPLPVVAADHPFDWGHCHARQDANER